MKQRVAASVLPAAMSLDANVSHNKFHSASVENCKTKIRDQSINNMVHPQEERAKRVHKTQQDIRLSRFRPHATSKLFQSSPRNL